MKEKTRRSFTRAERGYVAGYDFEMLSKLLIWQFFQIYFSFFFKAMPAYISYKVLVLVFQF